MWTSKIGNTAKTLVLGLTNDGVLVPFGSLSGPGGAGAPQLRLRQRNADPTTAVSFDLSAYAGGEAGYNAERVFSAADFATLEPGVYIAEVDAHISGQDVTFPDDGYITLKFLRGIE